MCGRTTIKFMDDDALELPLSSSELFGFTNLLHFSSTYRWFYLIPGTSLILFGYLLIRERDKKIHHISMILMVCLLIMYKIIQYRIRVVFDQCHLRCARPHADPELRQRRDHHLDLPPLVLTSDRHRRDVAARRGVQPRLQLRYHRQCANDHGGQRNPALQLRRPRPPDPRLCRQFHQQHLSGRDDVQPELRL